jgi:Fe2+ or Zn2+ uptake regulation protein
MIPTAKQPRPRLSGPACAGAARHGRETALRTLSGDASPRALPLLRVLGLEVESCSERVESCPTGRSTVLVLPWNGAPRTTPGELTPLRQMILDVLVGAGRPLGAYAIIAQLEITTGRRVLPTSMYRSLGALLECGLITRIESRNAFLAGVNTMTTPSDIYFICDRCGEARAIEATGPGNVNRA